MIRALIVEDKASMARMLERLFASKGYEVAVASDGAEAMGANGGGGRCAPAQGPWSLGLPALAGGACPEDQCMDWRSETEWR